MSPLDGTGPVMLEMRFASRFTCDRLQMGSERMITRLRAVPGVVTAEATLHECAGMVAVVCVFEGLLARERFVLSSLYDRLPALAGMRPGSRRVRRLDLGTTDRDDLAAATSLPA